MIHDRAAIASAVQSLCEVIIRLDNGRGGHGLGQAKRESLADEAMTQIGYAMVALTDIAHDENGVHIESMTFNPDETIINGTRRKRVRDGI